MIVIPIQFIIGLAAFGIGFVLLIILTIVNWVRKTIKKIKDKK